MKQSGGPGYRCAPRIIAIAHLTECFLVYTYPTAGMITAWCDSAARRHFTPTSTLATLPLEDVAFLRPPRPPMQSRLSAMAALAVPLASAWRVAAPLTPVMGFRFDLVAPSSLARSNADSFSHLPGAEVVRVVLRRHGEHPRLSSAVLCDKTRASP